MKPARRYSNKYNISPFQTCSTPGCKNSSLCWQCKLKSDEQAINRFGNVESALMLQDQFDSTNENAQDMLKKLKTTRKTILNNHKDTEDLYFTLNKALDKYKDELNDWIKKKRREHQDFENEDDNIIANIETSISDIKTQFKNSDETGRREAVRNIQNNILPFIDGITKELDLEREKQERGTREAIKKFGVTQLHEDLVRTQKDLEIVREQLRSAKGELRIFEKPSKEIEEPSTEMKDAKMILSMFVKIIDERNKNMALQGQRDYTINDQNEYIKFLEEGISNLSTKFNLPAFEPSPITKMIIKDSSDTKQEDPNQLWDKVLNAETFLGDRKGLAKEPDSQPKAEDEGFEVIEDDPNSVENQESKP